MWVDPVRGRHRLRRREGPEWGRRDERTVEARAEIVRLWRRWWRLLLVRVGRDRRRRSSSSEDLSCGLRRIAQLDRGRERAGRGRGVPEWMAIGGFSCACYLLCIM
jgi:hypothetical protein